MKKAKAAQKKKTNAKELKGNERNFIISPCMFRRHLEKRSYRRRDSAQNPVLVFYDVWTTSQGEFRDIPPSERLVVVVTIAN